MRITSRSYVSWISIFTFCLMAPRAAASDPLRSARDALGKAKGRVEQTGQLLEQWRKLLDELEDLFDPLPSETPEQGTDSRDDDPRRSVGGEDIGGSSGGTSEPEEAVGEDNAWGEEDPGSEESDEEMDSGDQGEGSDVTVSREFQYRERLFEGLHVKYLEAIQGALEAEFCREVRKGEYETSREYEERLERDIRRKHQQVERTADWSRGYRVTGAPVRLGAYNADQGVLECQVDLYPTRDGLYLRPSVLSNDPMAERRLLQVNQRPSGLGTVAISLRCEKEQAARLKALGERKALQADVTFQLGIWPVDWLAKSRNGQEACRCLRYLFVAPQVVTLNDGGRALETIRAVRM